jgi:hypothetical protein
MDPHREIARVVTVGLGAALLVGALVGHAIDLVLHRHRS